MAQKYRVFVVSHTHWDREWYGSFQLFRVRLVRLMNKLLDILDNDPEYKTFNLDGQTIILDDYLEIHPEKRDLLKRYIGEGRLMVGPWYILPDEFLTSAESLVRNLLLGAQMSDEFGHRMEVGYIPDTFGHIAQLPQILQGFELDTCMNFRGLDSGGRKSELWWQSPDGSQVLLHHMSTVIGYSDLGAMADDAQRAAYDLRATAYYKAERATGDVLLAMQGVDHVEARADLPMIINIANDSFDDVEFIHGSLEDFWNALKASVEGKTLETVHGELRDVPRTDGSMNFLLYNVLSSRVDNKIQNAQTLNSLENWAEPWAALAWMQGIADYPHGHLWTAWKWLLKNHPHDSIGGCSVDAVHRQMATRFEWAKEIADYLTEERFRLFAEKIDYSSAHDDELALTVFNANPSDIDRVITIDIDLPEYWLKQVALSNQKAMPELTPDSHYFDVKDVNTRADWLYGMPDLPEIFFRGIHIRSADGEILPLQIHTIEQSTTAIALASGPRGVMDVRRVRASFRAKIPAFGYASYFVKTDSKPLQWKPERKLKPNVLKNDFLTVTVQANGTFDIEVKGQSISYTGLGLLEDSGDNGDGYTFSPPPFNRVYTTTGANPRISRVGNDVGLQQIRIEHDFTLPISLDDARQKRRDDAVTCPITIDLILRENSPCLEIALTIDNRVKDHRLRMRFPVPIAVDEATSAMQFDTITRLIQPEPIQQGDWWVEDPADTFPMHGWMDISDPLLGGMSVIAEGLHEFAVEPHVDGRDIAITLLRSVGYLGARRDLTTIIGGAGPGIATPEAQLEQRLSMRLALYPHQDTWENTEIWREARQFLTGVRGVTTVPHEGDLPATAEGLHIEGQNAVLSSLKQSEDGTGLIVRLYNPAHEQTEAKIFTSQVIQQAWLTALNEQAISSLDVDGNTVHITLPAKKIVTVKLAINGMM